MWIKYCATANVIPRAIQAGFRFQNERWVRTFRTAGLWKVSTCLEPTVSLTESSVAE